MRTSIFLLLFLLFSGVLAQPIPQKTRHSVIIDTDGSVGDMRAISMMISNKSISIKAILLSDGVLDTHQTAIKIQSLLNSFQVKNIPIASGHSLNGLSCPESVFTRKIKWGDESEKNLEIMDLFDLPSNIFKDLSEKNILVCLGPLTNIAQLLKRYEDFRDGIEKIVWFTSEANPVGGYNYSSDSASADFLIRSGLRIDLISLPAIADYKLTPSFYTEINQPATQFARILKKVYGPVRFKKELKNNYGTLNEELAAIYLMIPDLFDMAPRIANPNLRYPKEINVIAVNEVITDLLRGTFVPDENVVFSSFPVNREMFRYDIRPIIDTAIALYGLDEWKANVMTDEFHGHLGVFSIVGAKMGIRAREYFGAGPDMLKVLSYAGSKPPYSCLNDGIQVSTGATVGMGTIALANDSILQPAAVFTFHNKSIRISIKKEFLSKVDADIKEGIIKFGLMDDGYWKLIRRNALRYWVEWDRNKIFDLTVLP